MGGVEDALVRAPAPDHRAHDVLRDHLLHVDRVVGREGDALQLHRLEPSIFWFETVPAGDTFFVELTTAAGPFKKVELYMQDSTPTQLNVPVFKHQSHTENDRNIRLAITPKFSLKRGLAHIEARSTPSARAQIHYTVRELLTQPNGTSIPDTIRRDWAIGDQNNKTLLDEQLVLRDSTGRVFRKKKSVTVVRHPAKPIALSPGGVLTLPRKKTLELNYTAYKPGDTLVFEVTALGGKPLKSVSLSDAHRRYSRKAMEKERFTDKVVAGREAYWTLRLEGHFELQKQMADVKVWRIPPTRTDSVFSRSDTTLLVQTIPLYDTLALLIKDDSLLLFPMLNLAQKNVSSMEIAVPASLPKGFELMFAAYWVGINYPCISTYQALEKTVPADWAKPGVPPALCAYALGMPLQLPPITLSDVVLAFNRGGAYPNDKYGAAPLWGVSLRQSMGNISAGDLQKARSQKGVYYFYVYFKNNNNVNTYPAQVKIIAFYRKKKGEEIKTSVLNIDNR